MVNKILLIGNLGAKPEGKELENSNWVCNFSLATSEKYKDETTTTWHRVVSFGNTAKACLEYLDKGSKVYVEGKLQKKKYTDKDGIERESTEVIAGVVRFLSSKGTEGNSDSIPF